MSEETRCPGCGAPVPDVDGPVHRYVPSAPGCWRAFGEIQADELNRFGYPPAHRIVVDAYMAQHPGEGSDRRDRQSVFVHLVGLCALLERSQPPERTRRLIAAITSRRGSFPHLTRAGGPGSLTVLHMTGASDVEEYSVRANDWAAAVWDSWEDQHALIRSTLDEVF